MTAAKSLARKEVERVKASLRAALKDECPEYPEVFLELPPDGPEPPTKRGRVLWEAYQLAWSAGARFSRRTEREKAKKRGEGVAFFDDRQPEIAIASLERAGALLRKGCEALEKDMARIRKERARLGIPGDDVGDHPEHVSDVRKIAKSVDHRVAQLKAFQRIPQARNRGEWDQFISRTAQKLLAVGFGTREVAGLLTGKKPEAVDRATLERFRQRVSRLEITKT